MNTYFRTTIIETSGIRNIAGGGTNASNAGQALLNLSGVSITGNQTISGIKTFADLTYTSGVVFTTTVPSTTGSAGISGQMALNTGFLYFCVGPNSWKRVALSTW